MRACDNIYTAVGYGGPGTEGIRVATKEAMTVTIGAWFGNPSYRIVSTTLTFDDRGCCYFTITSQGIKEIL